MLTGSGENENVKSTQTDRQTNVQTKDNRRSVKTLLSSQLRLPKNNSKKLNFMVIVENEYHLILMNFTNLYCSIFGHKAGPNFAEYNCYSFAVLVCIESSRDLPLVRFSGPQQNTYGDSAFAKRSAYY